MVSQTFRSKFWMYFPYLSTHLILADFVASVISGEDILLNLLLFSFLPCFYFLDLWPEYSPKQAVFKYLQYVLPLIRRTKINIPTKNQAKLQISILAETAVILRFRK
jgi:hypothetical protein